MHEVSCHLLYTNANMAKNRKSPALNVSLTQYYFKVRNIHCFSLRGAIYTTFRKTVLLRVLASPEFIVLCAHLLQFLPTGKKENQFSHFIQMVFLNIQVLRGIPNSRKGLKDTPGKVIL